MVSRSNFPQLRNVNFFCNLFTERLLQKKIKVWREKNLIIVYLFTDLGILIGNTQHGSFRIFLPLRFYVKSILGILKPQKLPFWPFEQLWILHFGNFWHFQGWNFSKNQNSKPSKLFKGLFLTFRNQPKLILRKIRVSGKLLNFPIVE